MDSEQAARDPEALSVQKDEGGGEDAVRPAKEAEADGQAALVRCAGTAPFSGQGTGVVPCHAQTAAGG